MDPRPFYITTPIYYVNDRPHIGHCYTTVVADVIARAQRLIRGLPNPEAGWKPAPQEPAPQEPVPQVGPGGVFLLTGTDEHADKVVTSAAEHGTTPQAWADKNAAEFRAAFESLDCSFDDFIRTTEPRHRDKVPAYISRLLASGDVYKGQYTGWYDPGQEEYLTETAAREANFKSPIGGKPLVQRTEPCYFFRLSAYQQRLADHINANPAFLRPESRRQEVLGRLRGGLNDVPISRPVTSDPATQWGIRIPGDADNRVYVWIDALFNYLTAVDMPERRRLWPPAVHLIGKDILWFHAVIWPALLMALNEPLPRTIFGHGWWISEGQKMSKSLGNFIDLEKVHAYARAYSLDAVRWFLASQGPLAGNDTDFSHAKFVEVYNADLANGVGNCASRVANMIGRYFDGRLPAPLPAGTPREGVLLRGSSFDWPAIAKAAVAEAIAAFESLDLHAALAAGVKLVSQIDGYINTTEPFKLAKLIGGGTVGGGPTLRVGSSGVTSGDGSSATGAGSSKETPRSGELPKAEEPTRSVGPPRSAERDALAEILYSCAEALRVASILLSPAMPTKMAALQQQFGGPPAAGVPLADLGAFNGPHGLKPGTPVAKADALFMRADPKERPAGV